MHWYCNEFLGVRTRLTKTRDLERIGLISTSVHSQPAVELRFVHFLKSAPKNLGLSVSFKYLVLQLLSQWCARIELMVLELCLILSPRPLPEVFCTFRSGRSLFDCHSISLMVRGIFGHLIAFPPTCFLHGRRLQIVILRACSDTAMNWFLYFFQNKAERSDRWWLSNNNRLHNLLVM